MIERIQWANVPVEEVNPKMRRQLVWGDKIMIARIRFKDGFLVPLHSHENEQITQVVSGVMRFWFGANREQTMDVHAGEVIVIPANVPHEALIIGDVEEIDTWAPPRHDWLDGTDAYLRSGASR